MTQLPTTGITIAMSTIPPVSDNGRPGSYGASQANLAYQMSQQNPQTLAASPVNITTPDSFQNGQLTKKGMDDYFGYAQQDVANFDHDGNGTLDVNEVQQAFGGDQTIAQKFMRAIDQDGAPGIGVQDMTAYILAQDNPLMYRDVYQGLNNQSNEMKNSLDQVYFDVFQAAAKANDPNIRDMGFDGVATQAERDALDTLIMNGPVTAGLGMKQLQSQLKLSDRYQDFLSRSAGSPPPPGAGGSSPQDNPQ